MYVCATKKGTHLGISPEKITNLLLFLGQVFELWFQVACSPWTWESYHTEGKMLYTVNSPRNQADLQPLLYPTHHACEQVPGEDGKKLAGEASRRARNPKNSESEAWGFVRRILFFALASLFEGYPRASFWFMVILLKWLLKRLLHKGLPVTPTCTWLCCVIRRFHFLHFIITASRLKSKKKFNIYSDLTKKTSFLTITAYHLPSNIFTFFDRLKGKWNRT